MPIKRISLTKLKVEIHREVRTSTLKEVLTKFDLQKQWNETSTAKKIAIRARRARLTDFERFRSMVLRRRLAHGLKKSVGVLLKGDKKGGKKAETQKKVKK